MLAGIPFHPKDGIDDLLGRLADYVTDKGLRVAGYVQKRRADRDCGTLVYVRNLGSGHEMPITKNRGAMARGCKLDGDALATLSEQLASDLDHTPDILIIGRFGRSEAEGRGLRDVISKALELGIPVLAGVRDEYDNAWQEFHGGYAQSLPFDETAIVQWWETLSLESEPQNA
tara:strand:- start:43893 stop:44411 length:519 start_codon:yes stop_codon:yes gene_type:complete